MKFSHLLKTDKHTSNEIGKIFSKTGLGYIVIKNIPNFSSLRSKVLKDGFQLMTSSNDELEKLRSKSKEFYIGYSNTPFVTDDGAKHIMHSSFVARAMRDTIRYPEDYKIEEGFRNIWPNEEFKKDFCDLGKIISICQQNLFRHLSVYLDSQINNFNEKYFQHLSNNHDVVSRLITYFPVENFKMTQKKVWDGWHTDYGLITALTHPLYFNRHGELETSSCSSLLIKDRFGNEINMKYEQDELCLILSNTFMFISAGLLHPTPHAVKLDDDMPPSFHRSNFATFFTPEFGYKINIPDNRSFCEIDSGVHHMNKFFENGISYKEYSEKLLDYLISRN